MSCTVFKKAVSCLTLLFSLSANAQMFEGGDDLALIWIGDRIRPDWNKELFSPYLVHTYEDGHKSWFFDGFLLLDGAYRTEDNVYQYTFGENTDLFQARRTEWEILLDRQLGLDTDLGVKALDEAIADAKMYMGDLTYKHKVVMMTPVPNAAAARNWGAVDGKELNFEVLDDRVKAIRWYVDRVIRKFEEANFKNVELSGIYWLRESIISPINEDLMAKKANEYIHERGLLSYWIPWYGAPNTENAKALGFDYTYIQPGYVFYENRPIERLTGAISQAWELDLGLEMEFEGKCISGYDGVTDTRVLEQQSNSSMYDANPTLFKRFESYIDYFESEMCFDGLPLSYYNGYQAIYDFQNSPNAKDRQLLDRLASFVERRHILGGWHEAAGVSDVESYMRVNIYSTPEGIFIGKGCPAAAIFSVDGRLVATTEPGVETSVTCEPGIYIVRCGDRSVKIKI